MRRSLVGLGLALMAGALYGQGPTSVSVNPANGSGAAGVTQTFTFSFSFASAGAAQAMTWMQGDIGASLTTSNSCFLQISTVYPFTTLLAAEGGGWMGQTISASNPSGSVSNSQCTLVASGLNAQLSGSTMQVTIGVRFSSAYLGVKNIFLAAGGNSGYLGGWSGSVGTYTVGSGVPQPSVTVSPINSSSAAGVQQVFTFTFAYGSAADAQTLAYMQADVGSTLTTLGSCFFQVATAAPYQLLIAADTGSWAPAGTTGNSQCSIAAVGISVLRSGSTVTIGVPITFTSAYQGTKNVYVLEMNSQGQSPAGGWAMAGSWTVTSGGGTQQYSLTTTVSPSGGGTITPFCPSGCLYNSGTVVSVSATPNSGYVFSGFSGDLSGTTTPQNLTMNAAKSITANFTQSSSPTITTASALPGGTFGATYSPVTLAAAGGTPPYVWSLASGLLPAPLTLSPGGVLSGAEVLKRGGQTFGFTVQVRDSLGVPATKDLTLALGPAVQPMAGPSRLEVGLSFMPFDEYDTSHSATTKFPYSCPSGSSIRGCFQTVLAKLREQSVSGVRIFFQLCGPDSTPLVNCGQRWQQVSFAGPNSTWMNNVKAFFDDLVTARIQNITLTVAHESGTLYSKPKSLVRSPFGDFTTLCPDAPDPVYFYAGAPFGHKPAGGGNYYPVGQGNDNLGYNCAPINPYFVGWQNQYDVINAMLGAAKATNYLNVFEIDFEQELNLMDFPVMARYIVDNAQTDSGQANVRDALNYYMSQNTFGTGHVTWSAPWSNSTLAGANCTSVYAGYARTMAADQIAAANGGGLIGVPNNLLPINDGTGYLSCDDGKGTYPFNMFPMPTYSAQPPPILDVHLRPCVADQTTHCVPNDSAAAVQSEAKIDFDDITNYIARFPLTTTIVLGETHSNSDNGAGTLCEGGTLNAPPRPWPGSIRASSQARARSSALGCNCNPLPETVLHIQATSGSTIN